MRTAIRPARQKISTTVAPETMSYLEDLIARGEAYNLAEAVDLAVERLRAVENRERLERDTIAYFEQLSPEALKEETELGAALAASGKAIDVDREP
jgi:hypothetical protein